MPNPRPPEREPEHPRRLEAGTPTNCATTDRRGAIRTGALVPTLRVGMPVPTLCVIFRPRPRVTDRRCATGIANFPRIVQRCAPENLESQIPPARTGACSLTPPKCLSYKLPSLTLTSSACKPRFSRDLFKGAQLFSNGRYRRDRVSVAEGSRSHALPGNPGASRPSSPCPDFSARLSTPT